ncbi:polysaccharide deacetylase family protein [Paenibacillus lautus]|uniref:polysaccharide deacetylase family protein n=1 Tax=Paenibacillus lautus TaxID=1401 RepID=UPI003D272F9C
MKRIITRADDYASSRSANLAITRTVESGFIKNVSIMAPGPYLTEAAQLLAHRKDICFGFHMTLNAEWDNVRWGPVAAKEQVPSLVDRAGYFYQDPILFQDHPPSLQEILVECEAQLDKLTTAGFNISYVDSHMLPERFIPGLQEELDRWIEAKGLINHRDYYNFFPGGVPDGVESFERVLGGLTEDQYFFLSHPALYSKEMVQCGNAQVDGEELARGRDQEASFLAREDLNEISERLGFRAIRYDEAVPLPGV